MTNGAPIRKEHHVGKLAGVARMLVVDIVLPLVVYRIARNAGVAEVWSLVLSGLPPAAGALFDWQRRHKVEAIGIFVLASIALSVVLALVSNDPKIVLLEGALTAAGFAIAHLLSIRLTRPLIFYFAQAFEGGRFSDAGIEMEVEFDRYREARSFWRTAAIVWGVVILAEAAIRVVLVQTVSTSTALAVNRIAPFAITSALIGWTYWAGSRARAEKPVTLAPDHSVPSTRQASTSVPPETTSREPGQLLIPPDP